LQCGFLLASFGSQNDRRQSDARRDIELDGTLAAYGFLLEMAFSIICELHPEGKQARLFK
jgi:hypothetical protein